MDKKAEFLLRYREALQNAYTWASDPATLNRFMASAERTIRNEANTWNHDSAIVSRVWCELTGGKGRASLKALRAL